MPFASTVARCAAQIALAGACIGPAQAATSVIFDQGPRTGSFGGCLANQSSFQHFADEAPVAAGTVITGVTIYTCASPPPPPARRDVTFKVTDQDSQRIIHREVGQPERWALDAISGLYALGYRLRKPYVVPAGLRLGYGLSGNAYDIKQAVVLTPGDGQMSVYSDAKFQFDTSVGDQMFRLRGLAADARHP